MGLALAALTPAPTTDKIRADLIFLNLDSQI